MSRRIRKHLKKFKMLMRAIRRPKIMVNKKLNYLKYLKRTM